MNPYEAQAGRQRTAAGMNRLMAMNRHSSPTKSGVNIDGREGLQDAYGAAKLNTAALNRNRCVGEAEQAGKYTQSGTNRSTQ